MEFFTLKTKDNPNELKRNICYKFQRDNLALFLLGLVYIIILVIVIKPMSLKFSIDAKSIRVLDYYVRKLHVISKNTCYWRLRLVFFK